MLPFVATLVGLALVSERRKGAMRAPAGLGKHAD
jgi:hypothetical protein